MNPRLVHTESVTVADLAVEAGLAMAAGDEHACASLRVTLARLIDTHNTPDAEHASAQALAEALFAFEDAQRVQAEHARQARAHRPLRENLLIELVQRGPSTPAELAAALHSDGNRVRYALRRLTLDGLVRPTERGPGRVRRHELSRAGVAAAMSG